GVRGNHEGSGLSRGGAEDPSRHQLARRPRSHRTGEAGAGNPASDRRPAAGAARERRREIGGEDMKSDGARGTVGVVRPTQRSGGSEELLAMLPQGIRLIPLCLDVRRGALDEFKAAIPAYEAKVAELARMGVDVINPSGAPPFMVLGYANEQALIRRWEAD